MNEEIPYKLNKIDLNNIIYNDIKSSNNKTIIFIKYQDNNKIKKLVFQVPFLKNEHTKLTNKNNLLNLDIPILFKSQKKYNNFENGLNNLEKKIINDSKVYKNKWFKSKKKLYFQKTIKKDKDKKYFFRYPLLNNKNFKTELECNEKNINVKNIPKNSWVRSIVELHGIWICDNNFGLFLKPIIISFKTVNIINYNFINSDEEQNINDETDSNIFIKPNEILLSNTSEENLVKYVNNSTTSS